MSNNPTSEQLTFLELLGKSDLISVEIPIIQRDYAQGREGKEEIRKNFLNALKDAIIKQQPLELDFVYGSIKQNVLQPLDGQQRLTTLYLLHWYIAQKENKAESESKILLSKFTYETRTTSREFCIALINKGIDFKNLLNADTTKEGKSKENQLSKTISDSSWFFRSWTKDPTIMSMLQMLDSIHFHFKDETELWNKLHNISFHYIELKDFGLSDELYIKMNARGKVLTGFENFKAKFEQYIKKNNWENNQDPTKSFIHKIDTTWTDLFWRYHDDKHLFDAQMMNFFRSMAVNHYALIGDSRNPTFRENIDLLRDNKKQIEFNQYIEIGCFDESYFNYIKAVLDKLSAKSGLQKYLSESSYINEEKIFSETISNQLSYPDSVTMFAYYQYLALEDNIDTQRLESWMRIIRNLVEGTRAYQFNNAIEYANALRSVNKLLQYRNSLVEYFANTQEPNLPGFTREQVNEEKQKSALILQSNEWEKAIFLIENYDYFNGQIGFLLDWSNTDGNPSLSLFNEYTVKAKAIFGNNGLNKFENYQFERALLATGNYLLEKGRNFSFLVDNDRDIGWKRILRDNNKKREILKQLVDKITPQTLNEDLQTCINDFSEANDWRYNFIKQPEIIDHSGTSKLIRWNNEKDILVLGSSTTGGYHLEYYSFSLYLKLKDLAYKNIDGSQLWQRSIDYVKSFALSKGTINYTISFASGMYQIDDSIQKHSFENQEEVCHFLNN